MRFLCWLFGHKMMWKKIEGIKGMTEVCSRCHVVLRLDRRSEDRDVKEGAETPSEKSKH